MLKVSDEKRAEMARIRSLKKGTPEYRAKAKELGYSPEWCGIWVDTPGPSPEALANAWKIILECYQRDHKLPEDNNTEIAGGPFDVPLSMSDAEEE
jgi:hypothetical protein